MRTAMQYYILSSRCLSGVFDTKQEEDGLRKTLPCDPWADHL